MSGAGVDDELRGWFATVERAERWRALAPGLGVGDGHAGVDERESTHVAAPLTVDRACAVLDHEGFFELPNAIPAAAADTFLGCLDRLGAAGIPPVFAFVYDEVWSLGAHLARVVGGVVGAEYEPIADFWVWHVAAGARGWPPHRDTGEVARRADGPPAHLNVWVAMTDAPLEASCISVVPLAEDPSYPSNLLCNDVPAGAARALPVARCTALVWDGNLLHWGTSSAPGANRRVSAAITLRRVGTGSGDVGARLAPVESAPLQTRLDAVARQVLEYKDRAELPRAAVEWAKLTTALAAHLRAKRG